MQSTQENTPNFTDATLLKKIILKDSGWQSAFTLLFERYERDIYRYSFSILKNQADAEDVLQEVFIRFYRSAYQFNGQSSLKTWLLRITENQCFSLINKKQTQQDRVKLIETIIDLSEQSYKADAYEAEQRKNTVSNTLKQINSSAREILSLRYWFDLSLEDIAFTLGIGLSAGKMRLHRAHQTCLQKIQQS